MKLVTTLFTLALVAVSLPALAGSPLEGEYTSLTGDMLAGRFSESWFGGGQGQIGNVVHAQSWNGSFLGSEWSIYCPVLAETPELINDGVDPVSGNGMREYRSVYAGGLFWLDGAGAWGSGDPVYTGTLDYYIHHTTFIFYNWVPIAYTTNADFAGQFDGYCMCILGIANAASVGQGAQPADYPMFLDDNCEDWTGQGEWGMVADVTLSIFDCASGAEPTTWGSIKTLYR
ncbi:MAG: hypothetical protein KAW17_11460 [Candidatus Eisenbacteria sp.]|nr:hypothetical protein [Candidatus Eisenbacteria bacterium]